METLETLAQIALSASLGACVGFTLVSLLCLLVFKPAAQDSNAAVEDAYSEGFDDGYEVGYDDAEQDFNDVYFPDEDVDE